MFTNNMHKSKMFRIKEVEDRLIYSAQCQDTTCLVGSFQRDYDDLVRYHLESSGAVLTQNNHVEIYIDGKEKFADLRRSMAKAKRFIHIQYYIIKNDEVFLSLIPILINRVKAGVEVRVLYDGMGGRFMPEKQWKQLRRAGIQVGCFFPPFLGKLQLRINDRNHRKIVVIDGEVGYVGGFNIGKEYLGKDPKFGYWRDTHLKIQGDAVMSLQIRFAMDWKYATKENLFQYSKYFMNNEKKYHGSIGIQIITSGPDSLTRQIRDNYLVLFHKARHHIYIQTPYFVPDEPILSALKLAVQSGVDVRLMIPCKPDHPFVYWATYSYVGELVKAGAKCYTYEDGFLHAKGVMIDGCVSSYGTANMDIRSFKLNFEVNAVIYDEITTKRLESIFRKDLHHCKRITKEKYQGRSPFIQIKEKGSRILSPLL